MQRACLGRLGQDTGTVDTHQARRCNWEMIGLSQDFCYQVIKQVGNYGDIYERHLGENTPIGLARGINAQWTDGGLLFAPPFR